MEELQQLFIQAVDQERLSHAYLLEGAKGVGKRSLAMFIAQLLFCQQRRKQEKPCGKCNHCQRIKTGNYPDLLEVFPEGTTIKVDHIRELKQRLSKTAMESLFKVCLLHDVDCLTIGAANSLLKLLEEPDSSILFLLDTSRLSNVLTTIQSRCQIVRLAEPAVETITQELFQRGVLLSYAQVLPYLTSDVEDAFAIANEETFLALYQVSWQWFIRVFQNRPMSFVSIQSQLSPLLTSKQQEKMLLDLLMIYVRDALYVAAELPQQVIQEDRLKTYQTFVTSGSLNRWIQVYERTQEILVKVQANVSLQAALEQWILRLPASNEGVKE